MNINADIKVNGTILEIKDYNSNVLELKNLVLQIDYRDILWWEDTQEIDFNAAAKIYIFHPRRWNDDLEIALNLADKHKFQCEFNQFIQTNKDLKAYYKAITEE